MQFVGMSSPARRIRDQIEVGAHSNAPALIGGETGTGRSLIAEAIHQAGPRQDQPCILFGAGLFGAGRKKKQSEVAPELIRLMDIAAGGTLVIDNVEELGSRSQKEVLTVLEASRSGDAPRIILTSESELFRRVRERRFLSKLFDFASVITIELPPLRERSEDMGPLTEHFLDQASRRVNQPVLKLRTSDLKHLEKASWPGNVRELKLLMELAVLRSDPEMSLLEEPPPDLEQSDRQGPRTLADLEDIERELLRQTLEDCKGRIYGELGAAARLEVPPTTLSYRLRKLGIRIPNRPASIRWDSSRLTR
jgi:formate hydrogenlyase transcriptional activator